MQIEPTLTCVLKGNINFSLKGKKILAIMRT
jgi:hypothetical protein